MGVAAVRAKRLFDFGKRTLIVGRVPLLPISVAEQLLHHPDPFAEALLTYQTSDLVRSAVEIASPELARALDDVRDCHERAVARLLAMLLRMAARATPFGLFAGSGMVESGDRTALRVRSRTGRLHGRADLGWLADVAERIVADAPSIDQLMLFSNALMLRRGGRLYFEHLQRGLGAGDYRRASVRATEAVDAAISAARNGARAATVVDRIERACRMPANRAEALVKALLRAGVLVPRYLGNPLACPGAAVAEEIERIDPIAGDLLRRVRTDLAEACAEPRAPAFRSVVVRARKLAASERSPIQVDAHLDFDGTLGRRVLDAVRILGEIAVTIAPRFDAANPYYRMFLRRYEGGDRLVPLLHFVGVFEDRDLLAGYAAPAVPSNAELAAQRILVLRLNETLRSRKAECILGDDDVAELLGSADEIELLPTFELAFQVAARSAEEVDGEDCLVVPTRISGTYRAGSSAARFATSNELVASRIRRFLEDAYDEDAVEIVYLPAIARHQNVAVRPPFTKRTIEFNVGESSERALDLAQLYVTVRGNRLVIWSEELRRFVRPVETTAYGTHVFGPPLARFLRAVGSAGAADILPLRWPQEELLPFTPRLRFRNAVLAVATWRVTLDDEAADDVRWNELGTFRRTWDVPREVMLVDGDGALPIDLETRAGKTLFLLLTKTMPVVTLQERLPSAAQCWVASQAGMHAAEFFVSCRSERGMFRSLNGDEAGAPRRTRSEPDRTWIYVRWFAAPVDADRLVVTAKQLREHVSEVVAVDDWHVLRYRSPRFHLRVRLRCAESSTSQQAVLEFSRRLVSDDIIESFELAEYEPERERYGTEGMSTVETFFTHSSEAAARVFAGPVRADRLVAALTTFDTILTSGLNGVALEEVMGTLRLSPRPLTRLERSAAQQLRAHRSDDLEGAARMVADLCGVPGPRKGRLLYDIFPDLAHMHFNRFGLDDETERSAYYVEWHHLRSRLHQAKRLPA